ncbi:unnamed protein product [Rotaria sordida]|uniref:Uncharacterized protein n=2 Tax=Rotaria sordida TaxID=392033 RepID=A0A814KZ69_9BILA|nr:unnamed protein product [Rotaria sordida]CAF1058825.1 unnamed protein product [Rotaria sordida]
MTEPIQQLQIIAEPKALYRERYGSELDKSENVAKRYIRAAEENQFKLEYPTIEISGAWYEAIHHPYIRVASVTVPNEHVSTTCVHPYPLGADDPAAVEDRPNNAIYFPISNDDFMSGRKSFLLTRKKLLQKELRSHSPFRIIDSTKRLDDNVFDVFPGTSVLSQVMIDEMNQKRDEVTTAPTGTTNDQDEKFAICAPERGNWGGGDNILMVLTKLDRKKGIL